MAMFNVMRSSSKMHSTYWGRYCTISGNVKVNPDPQNENVTCPGLLLKPKESDVKKITVADILATYASGYDVGSEYNPARFQKIMKQFQTEYTNDYPKDQSFLPLRTMKDSFRTVEFKFDHTGCNSIVYCPHLKVQTTRGTDVIKKQILSFHDVFAVWLSYKHLDIPSFDGRPNPYLMISGFLDHVSFIDCPMDDEKVVRTSSHVAQVSETTVDVVIESSQKDFTGKWEVKAKSMFKIAARNASLKKAPVNGLVGENKQEDEYIRQISNSVARRETFRKHTRDQKLTLGELALINNLKKKRHSCAVTIEDTKFEASQICDTEKRNRYYTTFGGFLITAAEDAAATSASLFCNCNPQLLHVGHGSFIHTVPLGSELRSQAMVTCTQDNLVHVPVISQFRDHRTGELTLANVFHFVYKVPDGTTFFPIIPKDDQEIMSYIVGRRFLEYIRNPETMYS